MKAGPETARSPGAGEIGRGVLRPYGVKAPDRPGLDRPSIPGGAVTDHDQLFKSLFQEFFGDLLRIVAPGKAPRFCW
jgi:hypothetical protein